VPLSARRATAAPDGSDELCPHHPRRHLLLINIASKFYLECTVWIHFNFLFWKFPY